MKFRIHAFDRNRELQKGVIIAESEAEARKRLTTLGYECLVQCDPLPSLRDSFLGYPSGTFAKLKRSHQFIRVDPARNVAVRTASGIEERRLIGEVEKLGAASYLQFALCVALFVLTALGVWWVFPPLRDVDAREWLTNEQQRQLGSFDPRLYKSIVLAVGHSSFTLVALMIGLALKLPLKRIGLLLLGVYGVQWLACSGVLDVESGGGPAARFMKDHPVYGVVAWALPAAVMIGAERLFRRVLNLTIPIYEDPETGKLEAGKSGAPGRWRPADFGSRGNMG